MGSARACQHLVRMVRLPEIGSRAHRCSEAFIIRTGALPNGMDEPSSHCAYPASSSSCARRYARSTSLAHNSIARA